MSNDKYEEAKASESTPGVKTGGYANDGSPDTRGLLEKAADALTGDTVDDKTGKRIDGPGDPAYAVDTPGSARVAGVDKGSSGNDAPGVQTGGYAQDGSPDTRGIMEKIADTITGDKVDDKTGKRVD
ncbi:hypothetical protein EON77_01385 [bacterium]|nr:MAG: hypothetical protein EON77_01385 [bacterium]